jgi:hypothetical protein
MDDKPLKKRSRWPVVVMALALLLPLLYVASVGPAWACVLSTKNMQEVHARNKAYEIAYWPIFWVCAHSRKASRLVGKYQDRCAIAFGVSDYPVPFPFDEDTLTL